MKMLSCNRQLWQVGNFNHGIRKGSWVWYNKVEYQERIENGKQIKKIKDEQHI
jgi:hypothetical protein